ncbi:MAG: hypothetical protein H8E20_14480 [Verrucomicrobia bacterium]|nr:hypothetical protein [Verrucomicrobiota bacterium]
MKTFENSVNELSRKILAVDDDKNLHPDISNTFDDVPCGVEYYFEPGQKIFQLKTYKDKGIIGKYPFPTAKKYGKIKGVICGNSALDEAIKNSPYNVLFVLGMYDSLGLPLYGYGNTVDFDEKDKILISAKRGHISKHELIRDSLKAKGHPTYEYVFLHEWFHAHGGFNHTRYRKVKKETPEVMSELQRALMFTWAAYYRGTEVNRREWRAVGCR